MKATPITSELNILLDELVARIDQLDLDTIVEEVPEHLTAEVNRLDALCQQKLQAVADSLCEERKAKLRTELAEAENRHMSQLTEQDEDEDDDVDPTLMDEYSGVLVLGSAVETVHGKVSTRFFCHRPLSNLEVHSIMSAWVTALWIAMPYPVLA